MVISPQQWGVMRVSKHHYALKLAERGNVVYFLDPPLISGDSDVPAVQILPSGVMYNLFIVKCRISFPYMIKFHFPLLFYRMMRPLIKAIKKSINRPVDIVWSFDIGNVFALRGFREASLRIFHPVDMPHLKQGIDAARSADLILSTSNSILDRYKGYAVPRHFINHGLADDFLDMPLPSTKNNEVHIGYSGNLLRHDIDRKVLLKIIRSNPEIVFEFWGSCAPGESNVGGGTDVEAITFIQALRALPNVKLHGAIPYQQLPSAFSRMDGFLICYDVKAPNFIGPNYHKIMEFLSTGKVIVSSFVGDYLDYPGLIEMTGADDNRGLPKLFSDVISRLSEYNSEVKCKKRQDFAFDHTYEKQIDRIEGLLSSL